LLRFFNQFALWWALPGSPSSSFDVTRFIHSLTAAIAAARAAYGELSAPANRMPEDVAHVLSSELAKVKCSSAALWRMTFSAAMRVHRMHALRSS
jgi:hypothetical protein